MAGLISRLRRWRTLLISIMAAALLVGVWWWRSPRSYRLVARHALHHETFVPCAAGVVCQLGPRLFVLFDWNGGERWRVAVPPDDLSGWSAEPPLEVFCWVSSDGRVFAAATRAGPQEKLHTWEGGKKVGETIVSTDHLQVFAQPLEDGRVFAWNRGGYKGSAVWLVKGSRLLARGLFTGGEMLTMAPDGKAATYHRGDTGDVWFTTVSVAGDRIRFSTYPGKHGPARVYLGSWPRGRKPLLVDGLVIADDGSVYGPRGKISGPTGWEHYGAAPGGRYVLEHRKDRWRVFSPVSGESWGGALDRECSGGFASGDGSHALALCTRPMLPPAINRLVDAAPLLGKRLGENDEALCLYLYERPGRLRAVTRIAGDGSIVRIGGKRYWVSDVSVSPDGRALALIGYAEKLRRYECLFMRW